jgi:hypothetical protein
LVAAIVVFACEHGQRHSQVNPEAFQLLPSFSQLSSSRWGLHRISIGLSNLRIDPCCFCGETGDHESLYVLAEAIGIPVGSRELLHATAFVTGLLAIDLAEEFPSRFLRLTTYGGTFLNG